MKAMKATIRFGNSAIRGVLARIRRVFVYNQYDSSAYWRRRAKEPSQASVLWRNQGYNDLYRTKQSVILEPYVRSLPAGSRVLDIGCGIGIVSEMMISQNSSIMIDAVDFEEMIDVAQDRLLDDRVNMICSSAESFETDEPKYDLIVSSACYSAIRSIPALERSLGNCCKMIKPGCLVVMIDPFHRWNYLARAKYSSKDVERFVKRHGLSLERKSGVLFWPFREVLADSGLSGKSLELAFAFGETLLSLFGRHFWADYKILVFRRNAGS